MKQESWSPVTSFIKTQGFDSLSFLISLGPKCCPVKQLKDVVFIDIVFIVSDPRKMKKMFKELVDGITAVH